VLLDHSATELVNRFAFKARASVWLMLALKSKSPANSAGDV
jgi:hypothetical protein